MPRLRIALLSADYPPQPGGVGDYTQRLGEALVARGHNVFVFTIYDLRFTIYDLSNPDANRKSELVNRKSDWGWGCWRAVIGALDELRPDVLHIQYQTGAYGMHPAINLLPWRLRRLPARPRVAVTAHDLLLPYLFPKAGPLRRWVTRRLLADADAVVVTNEADFTRLTDDRRPTTDDRRGTHYGTQWSVLGSIASPSASLRAWLKEKSRFSVLRRSAVGGQRSINPVLIPIGSNISVAPPPGYERDAWRGRLGVAAGETLIAYFGLISRSKGLDVLLGALAQLPQTFRLLVVGGAATRSEDRAYAAEIQRQIDDQGLHERVIVTGHCAESEVSAHLLAADMAALPFADGASFRRGSLLAALAHGVPTVTTTDDRPTTNDQRPTTMPPSILRPSSFVLRPLVDGENVLLVPPGDAGALAAAIERLARDAALRERLRAGGRALAAQFAWETIAARHEALYSGLVRR